MKRLLSIETSTEACSVALLQGHERTVWRDVVPRQHTRLLLPKIDQLLADAGITLSQLDALAFGCGPGAFTGVRIATAAVQGLALALDRPVLPISSLAALAWQGWQEQGAAEGSTVLAAIDARMSEVYAGAYRLYADRAEPLLPEQVCPPDAYPWQALADYGGAGTGWCYAAQLVQQAGAQPLWVRESCFPDAEAVAVLAAHAWEQGLAVDAADAQPTYLRDQVTS